MEQPLGNWATCPPNLQAPDDDDEARAMNDLRISQAETNIDGTPVIVDYAADNEFCIEDFIDFDGTAGLLDGPCAGKRSPHRRRSQRSHPAPVLDGADEEMVLPPCLQPVITTVNGHESNTTMLGDEPDLSTPAPLKLEDAASEEENASELDLNDLTTRELYDKVLLFSHRNTSQDHLVFDDCDQTREKILRKLTCSLFSLDLSVDTANRRVSIARPSSSSNATSSQYSDCRRSCKTEEIDTRDCPTDSVSRPLPGARAASSSPRLSSEISLPLRTVSPEQPCLGSSVYDKPKNGHLSNTRKYSMPDSTTGLCDPGSLEPFPGGCRSPKTSSVSQNTTIATSVDGRTFRRPQTRTAGSSASQVSSKHSLYASRSRKTTVRQRLHTWTSKTIDKYGGHLGVLHEDVLDPRATKRRALYSKSLENLGGPCWRCMILGLRCDAEESCRECPALSLEEDAPLWPLVGCRRGPLSLAMPPPILCSGTRKGHGRPRPSSPDTQRAAILIPSETEIAAKFLRRAEGQRMQDTKAILEDDTVDADSNAPSLNAASVFVDIIKNRQYRDNVPLNRRYWSRGKSFTYAELISTISWELMDNSCTVPDLEIESVDNFIQLLEIASSCEGDFCSTWLVFISLICLKDCLDTLRLMYAGLLAPESHGACSGGECEAIGLCDLRAHIADYTEELSRVLFKSERRDKHCWLSIFFSLYIQSYVRHALLVVEKQLNPTETDEPTGVAHSAMNYLHLAATLFGAASAQFDPVFPGRTADQRNESPVPEHLELYVSYARTVCLVEASFFEGAVATSFEFLRRMLQIGAPDFDQEEASLDPFGAWNVGIEVMEAVPVRGQDEISSDNCIGGPSNEQCSMMDDSISEAFSFDPLKYDGAASTLNSAKSSESLLTSLFSFEIQSPLAASFQDYASTCSISMESTQDQRTSMQAVRPYMQLPDPNYSARPLPEVPFQQSTSPTADISDSTLICDCCPKRPQVFQTAEELQTHMQKKPHVCEICGARSKNKNEAKRHHNAVHLRPFSWSCRKLGTPLSAFQVHVQQARRTLCYTCGFCGRTFHREATAPLMVGERLGELEGHVRTEHKFGMCSGDKRFFRDDHFSQHLKTVHGALAGEWLKALVESCKSKEA